MMGAFDSIKCPKCSASGTDIRINPAHIGKKTDVELRCAECGHQWVEKEIPETAECTADESPEYYLNSEQEIVT